MSRPVRTLIAFIIVVIAVIVTIHVKNIPPESYSPPTAMVKNATAQAYGRIISTREEGFSGHLLSGSDVFYYIEYTFQPTSQRVRLPDGTTEHKDYPTPYTGDVRVNSLDDMNYAVGKYVTVDYDPVDPTINGVPGTQGVWTKSVSNVGPYLWWYVGAFAAIVVLQELMRMVTRTNDFRA